MFEISCENCGSDLIIDEAATADAYFKDMNYLTDDVGKIVEESLQQYLIYTCLNCESFYRYTYKEWEALKRRLIAEDVMELRKQHMFRNEINPNIVNADNGIAFCGQCSGYFNDGTCMNDIIKQCTIRKKDV